MVRKPARPVWAGTGGASGLRPGRAYPRSPRPFRHLVQRLRKLSPRPVGELLLALVPDRTNPTRLRLSPELIGTIVMRRLR
jgi:hypothetical protein